MSQSAIRVAIARFGTVGRAVGEMLLTRRERYRRVYGVDVRLVAVCESRSGLSAEAGIEADRFDALEKGKSGPAFIAASNADVVIEAGRTDRRTGAPGLDYIRSALSDGRDVIVISKGALTVAIQDPREQARVGRTIEGLRRGRSGAADDRPVAGRAQGVRCRSAGASAIAAASAASFFCRLTNGFT